MKQPDLEQLIIERAELHKTIEAAGESDSASAAKSLLRSLEGNLKKRIDADIWGTTEAIYRLNQMLKKELNQAV
ncbi:hypothetical protein [Endozoicomonas acroporae]|uniref:hypothetical protein n=1 Tax=Endozoicomonas acroporae TaxID=1701104 RepID=UPI003D7C00A1